MIWVLGRGGLLGGAVSREVGKFHDVWAPSKPISWVDIDSFRSTMDAAIDEFSSRLVGSGGKWKIYWCAGVGTIGASDDEINGEFERAEYFLGELGSRLVGGVSDGALFYSSSAGGIYGASTKAPISEDSEVAINSAYGSMKFRVENLFTYKVPDEQLTTEVRVIAPNCNRPDITDGLNEPGGHGHID